MEKKIYAFSGARNLPEKFRPLVEKVVRSCAKKGEIITGDARGLDQYVRETGLVKKVFTPEMVDSSYSKYQALMQRSFLMVRHSSEVIAFTQKPCPINMPIPSPSGREKIVGFSSGTWSTLAYAIQKQRHIYIFICGNYELPNWSNGKVSWQYGVRDGVTFGYLR